jgi:hypothetical protein
MTGRLLPLLLAFCLLCAGTAAFGQPSPAARADRPNIVIILADDLGAHRRAPWADRVPEDSAQGRPLLHSIGSSEAGPDEVARLKEDNARLREELEHPRPGEQ